MIIWWVLGAAVVLALALGWLADRRRRGWDTRLDSRSPRRPGSHGVVDQSTGSGGLGPGGL